MSGTQPTPNQKSISPLNKAFNFFYVASWSILAGTIIELLMLIYNKQTSVYVDVLAIYSFDVIILIVSIFVIELPEKNVNSIKKLGTKMLLFVFATIITQIVLYADVYRHFGVLDSSIPGENKNAKDVGTFLYLSVITWTTVGYGDVVPERGWARFFAASEAISGLLTNYFALAALIAAFRFKFRRL